MAARFAGTLSVLAIAMALSGCASSVTLHTRFQPREVAWFAARGTNTIEGTAIARAYNGTAKTCAALPVTLFPVSAYARERMTALYDSDQEGFNPILMGRPARFDNDDPRYIQTAKTTRCDAHGHFAFGELPDGDYFLVGEVTWQDRRAGLLQGGYLMRRIHVAAGESKEVLLAH
ncbi:MAG: hypothetical protein P4L57_13045 [Rhizomicrobium sp.]|nr:hypothetical protein [Rhizomicrobium sp.]